MTCRSQRVFSSWMRSMRQTRTRPGQFWLSREGGGRTAMRRISMRPCSLSIVSARSRSGGSTRRFGALGSTATRAGGIIAEDVRDLGLEFGLVGFDKQEIAGPLGPDRCDNRAIGEGGIAGHDIARADRQVLQQGDGFDYFGAVGRHR